MIGQLLQSFLSQFLPNLIISAAAEQLHLVALETPLQRCPCLMVTFQTLIRFILSSYTNHWQYLGENYNDKFFVPKIKKFWRKLSSSLQK